MGANLHWKENQPGGGLFLCTYYDIIKGGWMDVCAISKIEKCT